MAAAWLVYPRTDCRLLDQRNTAQVIGHVGATVLNRDIQRIADGVQVLHQYWCSRVRPVDLDHARVTIGDLEQQLALDLHAVHSQRSAAPAGQFSRTAQGFVLQLEACGCLGPVIVAVAAGFPDIDGVDAIRQR